MNTLESSDLSGDIGLTVRQLGYELRGFARSRARLVFTLGFPLMFLLLFGTIDNTKHISQYGGISYDQFFVPGILAYAVITTSFVNISITTAIARDAGVIKRMQGTPLPRLAYMLARIGATVIVVGTATAITLLVGCLAYGVKIPAANIPADVAMLLLGTATFTTLGIAIVKLIPNADSAPAIVNIFVLPLTFISGIWFVPAGMPKVLADIAKVFPVQPLANGLQHAFNPHVPGPGLSGADVRTLAIWLAIGVFGMIRFMRSPGSKTK
jgi:ABC-2 type transport system permease protein